MLFILLIKNIVRQSRLANGSDMRFRPRHEFVEHEHRSRVVNASKENQQRIEEEKRAEKWWKRIQMFYNFIEKNTPSIPGKLDVHGILEKKKTRN